MNYPGDKSKKIYGVLLLSYGGPSGIDEIESFLKSITGLSQVPENYINMVKEKYELIGGRSPFKEITSAQAKLLQNALGDNPVVSHGFRHSKPSIKDAIEKLLNSGVNRIIGLCLTPHFSTLSCGEYIKTASQYLDDYAHEVSTYFIKSWHNNIDYINLLSERIKKSLSKFTSRKNCLLFTAHSLPLERLSQDDPYVQQLEETVGLITKIIPLERRLAFQSRRPGKDKWLEPDVKDEMKRIRDDGIENVVVVPLSFVSDHLETLYDIDIILKKQANDYGITLERIEQFNTDPDFINILRKIVIDLIREKNL